MLMPVKATVNWSSCEFHGGHEFGNFTLNIVSQKFGQIGPKIYMEEEDLSPNDNESSAPSKLTLITAIILIAFINYKGNYVKRIIDNQLPENTRYKDILFQVSCFLGFVLLLPFLTAVCLLFAVHRKLIERKLKKKYGANFKGLLDGEDVVWALEADASLSVINIVGFFNADENSHTNRLPSAEIVLALRKRISSKLRGMVQPHPKMFYRRLNDLGFYFWYRGDYCNIEEYIRYMDYIPQSFSFTEDNLSVTEDTLRAQIAKYCNRPLPHNHQSSWEILVGKQPMREENVPKGAKRSFRYPVLFRCHHSLGDGVALLRLLLETIADKDSPSLKLWRKYSNIKGPLTETNFDAELEELREHYAESQTKLERFQDFVERFRLERIWMQLQQVLKKLSIIFLAPSVLFYQGALKPFDKNPIHGPELSGKKVVGNYFEPENDGRLLSTVKIIKQHVDGARFSDVLLTVLSKSLHRYFSQKIFDLDADEIPEEITVVLPIRMEAEGVQLKIQNRFSVALQTLPILPGSDAIQESEKLEQSKKHIEAIKSHTDTLRASPDYVINYWIMSFVSGLFPDTVLKKLVKSAHSTMAVSNLPGPQQSVTIKDYELKNLCFWIPNIGTTGVGITVLSFRGHLQLGLMADKVLIGSNEEAQSILNQMIEEIHLMGKIFNDIDE